MSDTFITTLITKGRRTGREHIVKLKAVKHDEKLYFSRHRSDSDWFQNALVHSQVKVAYNGQLHIGVASEITDPILVQTISHLKYPGEDRAMEKRVVIEVTLQCKDDIP